MNLRSIDRVRSYLAGTLSPADREAFLDQASRDSTLRQLLLEAHRQQRPAEQWPDVPPEVRAALLAKGRDEARKLERRRLIQRAALAATVLLGCGLVAWWSLRPPTQSPGEVLRTGPGSLEGELELLLPGPELPLPGSSLELSWQPLKRARAYTVFLLDERGDILRRERVGEPPHRLELEAEGRALGGRAFGERLCWYVVAELDDGGTLASAVRCGTLAAPGEP